MCDVQELERIIVDLQGNGATIPCVCRAMTDWQAHCNTIGMHQLMPQSPRLM